MSVLQCLCVSPTYELALQTGKVIEQMGKFYPEVKLAYAVRGHKSKWLNEASESCDVKADLYVWWLLCPLPVERGVMIKEQIVIGTPGTVLDWCVKLKLIDPKKIKVFVLDEADVMIATQGHQDQSIRIQRWTPHASKYTKTGCWLYDLLWMFLYLDLIHNV